MTIIENRIKSMKLKHSPSIVAASSYQLCIVVASRLHLRCIFAKSPQCLAPFYVTCRLHSYIAAPHLHNHSFRRKPARPAARNKFGFYSCVGVYGIYIYIYIYINLYIYLSIYRFISISYFLSEKYKKHIYIYIYVFM